MEMAAFTIPDQTAQADVLIDEVRKLHVIWEKRTEETEARMRTLEKEHRSYQEHKRQLGELRLQIKEMEETEVRVTEEYQEADRSYTAKQAAASQMRQEIRYGKGCHLHIRCCCLIPFFFQTTIQASKLIFFSSE